MGEVVEFRYNSNYHQSIQMTPFEALYGYKPTQLGLSPYMQGCTTVASDLLTERQRIIQILKENLHTAMNRMKKYADMHRSERKFEIGDLRMQPFRNAPNQLRKQTKLSFKYFGPYRVMQKVGEVTYKLDLPNGCRLHPVFHVSKLKKQIKNKYTPQEQLS